MDVCFHSTKTNLCQGGYMLTYSTFYHSQHDLDKA